MTYEEAEQFILSLSNLESQKKRREPKVIEEKHREIQTLLYILGNPEKQIPHYIHVTGTSGKGSVCTFLNSLLQKKYNKVGMCISPHHIFLLERWQYQGNKMKKREFIEIIKELKKGLVEYMRQTEYETPSFFMITTLIGLMYFAKKKAEFAIFEVGIGGRSDSTNIIPNKDIAVITNIGYDHLGILGNTKEQIAHEKSGIIKENCKVFTLETNKALLDIFQKECDEKKVILQKVQKKFTLLAQSIEKTSFEYKQTPYHIPVFGIHQIHNAILSIEIARFLGIDTKSIQLALRNTKQDLRLEVLQKTPLTLIDGAHNQDKIKSTVEAILDIKRKNQRFEDIHLIVGMSADRSIEQKIKELCKLRPQTIACSRNTINPFTKVTSPKQLQKLFKQYLPKTKIEIFLDPQEALHWSKKQQKKNDIMLSTGSIFFSGEIKNIFTKVDRENKLD